VRSPIFYLQCGSHLDFFFAADGDAAALPLAAVGVGVGGAEEKYVGEACAHFKFKVAVAHIFDTKRRLAAVAGAACPEMSATPERKRVERG